jgi:hypothetical protein
MVLQGETIVCQTHCLTACDIPWKGSAALTTCWPYKVLVAPARSACGLGKSIVLSMQAVSSWPETMRMSSCGFNSVDQAAFAAEIDLCCHAVGRSSAQCAYARTRILDADAQGLSESSRR